jgi:hypothetical protein
VVKDGKNGVWSMEPFWYEFSHHAMPDARVDFRIRREVPWFPDPTREEAAAGYPADGPGALLIDYVVDRTHGLVFAVVQAKDPDAPGPWEAMMSGAATPTGDEMTRQAAIYLDGVMEVFTFDGRLLASRRYEYRPDVPLPLTPRLFYRADDSDLFPLIEILEPMLVQNPRVESDPAAR